MNITDANGCQAQYVFSVPIDWNALALSAQITNSPACGSGGAIDLTVTGGTGPYGYDWGLSTTEDLSGIPAGTYNVQVTDQNGCRAYASYVVDGTPKSVNFTADIIGTCNGLAQGAINITMTGGVPPFQFNWGGPGGFSASSEDVGSLQPGNYWLLVEDAVGCTASENYAVPLEDPFTLSVVLSPSCNSTGSIDLTVLGGVGPFQFFWYNGAQTTEDLVNVPNNFYVVDVTDANGCLVQGYWYLGALPMNLNMSTVQPACYGESNGGINLVVDQGTAPFTYAWSTGATTEDLAGLSPGAYSVTVTDANGCSASSQFNVGQNGVLTLVPTYIYESCSDNPSGGIVLGFGGGAPPYSFTWTGPGGFTSTSKNPSLMNILPGVYTVTMTDAVGCTLVATYTVPAFPTVTLGAALVPSCAGQSDGSIDLTAGGGTPPFSYSWTGPSGFSASTEDISSLDPGSYTVVVSDLQATAICFTQATWVIPEITCCPASLVIPDGTLSSTLPYTISGTVDIQGQFIVDDDLFFLGAQITMEPGAEIIVLDGVNMDMQGTSISSCQDQMWRSISVRDGASLWMYNCFIDDGEKAVICEHGATVVAQECFFHNDLIGIHVPWMNAGLPTTLVVRECTFYSSGGLKQPYPGQTTVVGDVGFAGIDVWQYYLDLSQSGNFFHHLSNGIRGWRSDMSISSCTFQDIQPDPAYGTGSNGSAIYGRGSHGLFTIKQNGYGASGTESFTNCRWGIYSQYMNVSSADNKMGNVGTAYHVEHAAYGDVDILDNALDTRYDGIQLYDNGGAHHLLVQNNQITFGSPPPPNSKGYAAIRVSEANIKNLDSRILNNDIYFRPLTTTARFGILLGAANNYQVSDNELFMVDGAVNEAGIRINGCEQTLISCNNVHGSIVNLGTNLAQSGIRANISANSTISCNTVDRTTNGIFFTGGCFSTDLRGNNFYNHNWGLHLEGNAIIDAQDVKGNLWNPNTVPGHIDAWHEGVPAVVLLSSMLVNPALVGAATTLPTSIVPNDWFFPSSDPNFLCDDGGANYCDLQIRMDCPDCKTELDERIAADDLQNNPYTEETKWIMKGELLEKLDATPDLVDQEADLAAFYADMQNTTISQFKVISNENLALFDLDATVSAYLVQNKAQIAALMVQLSAALDLLADPDLTPAQRQAHLATTTGLQANIASLVALNDQALTLAANSRVLTAEAVKNTNGTIGATEQIEVNEKVMNTIYLNTLAKDVDAFSQSEVLDLFDVANQCPLVGGVAVYRARALYDLIDDSQDFNDPALCLQHGIITRHMEQPNGQALIGILPNPASDEAVLVYNLSEGTTGHLMLYDALGQEVERYRLSTDAQRFHFSTTGLAPGAYHYVVLQNDTILGEGKLAIAH